jgi:hypothetical protein
MKTLLIMSTFLEILKYILPSVVVLATTVYLVKSFLVHDDNRKVMQLRMDVQKVSLPVRMQAYERLVLLLERVQPAGLILRNNQPGMNAGSMHSALLQSIREEYEHNLSQQLYVSTQAWELVRNSREESIKLINTAGSQVAPEAPAAELAQHILIQDMEASQDTTIKAIEFLKKEARDNFF